ncbi:MAG: hypothetical protein IT305_29435 [Chloroflexi bacterium]|nr:hypothetical protein [Chloroflexota bacterium]
MPNDPDLTLNIATPAGLYTATFPKTAKVSEVIVAVVEAMSLADGDAFELAWNGEVLQPTTRPLVSFGLEDGAQLDLVATGAAV